MANFHLVLAQKYWGTTLQSWLIAAGLALSVTFGLVVAKRCGESNSLKMVDREGHRGG